jgi:eukaryotic-like serine/threonine-protein kinase
VKRIHDHVVANPKFRQLFEAEVRSMANFAHPYAVRLLDAAVDDPIGPCLVMEYVPGVTLEDLLARHRRIMPDRAGRLLGYFCHALQAAHDAGIIHRDLKPANLMVVNAGQPTESIKVMDFGFAGFVAKPHIQLAELTGHGPIYAIGTPAYVSPEMIRGDRVDTRSDVYSVGVILFELLTGRLPFNHEVMEKLLAAHVKDSPPKFHKIGCAHVPAGVEGVVQLALSKYPNERQQTAREIADAFGQALGGVKLWEQTAPAGWEPPREARPAHRTPPARPSPPAPPDPYRVTAAFEVSIPERLVAAKIRGFVEDVDAKVLASEPGLVRLQVGVSTEHQKAPATGSSIFMWLNTLRKPPVVKGQEPIEIALHMEKPNPALARLRLTVTCGPVSGYPPQNIAVWRERCEKLHAMVRQYLGG